MRAISTPLAAALILVASAALAQSPNTASGASAPNAVGAASPPPGGPPQIGGPLLPATDHGLDKVGSDGVSTRTVRAVPCSAAARETDGSTTCVGIPGSIRETQAGTFPDGTTTGMGH
jgi:hypothetical protein